MCNRLLSPPQLWLAECARPLGYQGRPTVMMEVSEQSVVSPLDHTAVEADSFVENDDGTRV